MPLLSRWNLTKVLYTVRSADLRIKHWSLCNRPIALFALLNTSSLRCSSNDGRLPSIIPKSFFWCRLINWIIECQKKIGILTKFYTENNLLSLYTKIWIKTYFLMVLSIFHLKLLFSSAAELSTLCTTENNEVSSANILYLTFTWI